MSTAPTAGEIVYLAPRAIDTPAICYQQPRATVTKPGTPYATVRLDDGTEHRIHVDNLAHTQPPAIETGEHRG